MGVNTLAWEHNKVCGVIVEAITVLMVDYLARKQGAAQGLLSQPPVCQHPLPCCQISDIGIDLALFDGSPSSPLLGRVDAPRYGDVACRRQNSYSLISLLMN